LKGTAGGGLKQPARLVKPKSNTSPAVLGERRARFEEEIAAALEPFAQHGILREQIVARASIFGRAPGSTEALCL
jgi:hypothetical protein